MKIKGQEPINKGDQVTFLFSILKIAGLLLLPLTILYLSVFGGMIFRKVISQEIEKHYAKQGLFLEIDKVGLRKYISIVKSGSRVKKQASETLTREKFEATLIDALKEHVGSEEYMLYAACEVFDLNTCFLGSLVQNRSPVIGLYGKGNLSRELFNKKEYYFSLIHKISEEITKGIGRWKEIYHSAVGDVKKSYPLATAKSFEEIKKRALLLLNINAKNYFLMTRDFSLPTSKNYNSAKARAYRVSNNEIEVVNLSGQELMISSLIKDFPKGKDKTYLIEKKIGLSKPYEYPTSTIIESPKGEEKKEVLLVDGKEVSVIPHYSMPNRSSFVEKDKYELKDLIALGFKLEKNKILFTRKSLTLKQPLIIDSGLELHLPGPLSIMVMKNAYIMTNGPIHFGERGKVEFSPINELWGGLLVMNANKRSTLKQTTFNHSGHFKSGDILLTGAINFYKSDVSIEDSNFLNNHSEDALNIVSSDFNIKKANFKDTPSDAFDSDFSTGIISHSTFEGVGGDGFDVSGTEGRIEYSSFNNIRDKAISVGEASNIKSRENLIRDVGTGIASKDRSTATDENSTYVKIKHNVFASYVKKPEYGPALIEVSNPKVEKGAKLFLVQNGSRLVFNGKEVEGSNIDIKEIYNSGYMKK